jgi:hypothetical protein
MQPIHLSGLIVQPIAQRIRDWNLDGKISEEDFDRVLSSDGRALVDHSLAPGDWVPAPDVEGLIGLAAEQLGGETGLVEWADEIVSGWQLEPAIEDLIHAGRALADSPGFVVSQAIELIVRDANWTYDGGRTSFSVRLAGLGDVSPALKALIGALLARLALAPATLDFDVRFDGVDGDDLVVFGEAPDGTDDGQGESRLHQAALVA